MEADVQRHPIRRWHIFIGGFLQTEGKPTGISAAWHRIHCAVSGPQTVVILKSWRNNWSDAAEWVYRMRNGTTPDVRIYGYSWGGYSATLLAKELRRRAIPVSHMVLCDPVYRHWYKLGQWRAMVPWSEIRIPSNVREVSWLRQQNPRWQPILSGHWPQPAGHELIAERPYNAATGQGTRLNDPILLDCEHVWADDDIRFHQLVDQVATA